MCAYSTSAYYEAQFYPYLFPILTFETVCVPHSRRKCCTVLHNALYSLGCDRWKLGVFSQSNFHFSSVTLIDSDLRVPASDCAEIANLRGAFGEDNVIEHRLYTQLCQATEQLGGRIQMVERLSNQESYIDSTNAIERGTEVIDA